MHDHLKFLVRWGIALLSSWRTRYISLSPPFFKTQLLLDKRRWKVIKVFIRDYSDWISLRQVFFNDDYDLQTLARFDELSRAYEAIISTGIQPLIVDCGANIGLSVLKFSSDFPDALVVAIELEENNFSQMALNARHQSNVVMLNAAVASFRGSVGVSDPGLGNNAFRADFDGSYGASTVQTVTIGDIINRYPVAEPFIVKIDIEGGEQELFKAETEWFDKFPLAIVELHDWLRPRTGSSLNFLKVVSRANRDFLIEGENIFSIKN